MNMNDGRLDGKQIFPADVVRAVHTGYTKTVREVPPFTGEGEYGLGWQIGKYKNDRVIYHHGGFPGYQSHISFMPDKRIAVAVLTNDGFAGGRAVHLLATYAYDLLLGSPNVESDYSKQLQEFVDSYEKGKQQQMRAAADRAKRTSQLTRPLAEYAGKYVNELFGTVQVDAGGSNLTVKMGNISVVSTPFTAPETIRVEMVPGSGEVIKFNKDSEGKIVSLTYASATFARSAP
jgi:hypothetical protein